MIAFKSFALCPPNQQPLGIPLSYPWVQEFCTEDQVIEKRRAGWTVVSEEEYIIYVDSLADVFSAWETAKLQLDIEQIVSSAGQFGQALMVSFAAENVLLGITYDGQTGVVLNKLVDVKNALTSGSLYEAITRIRTIDPADYDVKYITEARLLIFINKIETYLGIPLSESV